jgi:putative hydrolase of the HAD superfamily
MTTFDPATPFEAVTFDLDGTLYPFPPVRWRFVLRNWRRVKLLMETMAYRERVRGKTFDGREEYRREEAKAVAHAVGQPEADVRAAIDQLLETSLCRVLRRVGPSPDARPVLEALVKAGLKVAVVSDYPPQNKLKALGLADIPFLSLVAADELGALKPDARAFLAAAEEMGVSPQRVVHIGDRMDADVAGAQAAGMWPILLKRRYAGPTIAEGWVCPNLRQAMERILRDGRPPPPLDSH